MTESKSLKDLRIYRLSRELEEEVYNLARSLPESEFFGLGDGLRRSVAAVPHYIAESHDRYSYRLKLECLYLARTALDKLRGQLEDYSARGFGETKKLQNSCTGLTKQTWALIRYLKQQQTERQTASRVRSVDELVAARS